MSRLSLKTSAHAHNALKLDIDIQTIDIQALPNINTLILFPTFWADLQIQRLVKHGASAPSACLTAVQGKQAGAALGTACIKLSSNTRPGPVLHACTSVHCITVPHPASGPAACSCAGPCTSQVHPPPVRAAPHSASDQPAQHQQDSLVI